MPSSTLRFRAVIAIRGINPYVLVHRKQAARLKPDWRRPMPVRIRVNGQPDVPWRINMMPAGGGDFFLYLHGQVRKASGANVGDTVSVMVEFDDEYRGGPTEPMPAWFSDALRRNAIVRDNWDKLPPSRRKEIFRYLTRLKSPQARQRNLQQALHVLAGGKARFMGRSWN